MPKKKQVRILPSIHENKPKTGMSSFPVHKERKDRSQVSDQDELGDLLDKEDLEELLDNMQNQRDGE